MACRYCFDDDDLENLISPCKCNGTSRYVHRKCLDTWRTTCPDPTRCSECHFTYEIEVPADKNTQILLQNAQDIFIAVVIAVVLVVTLGLTIEHFDTQGNVRHNFFNSRAAYWMIAIAFIGVFWFVFFSAEFSQVSQAIRGQSAIGCFTIISVMFTLPSNYIFAVMVAYPLILFYDHLFSIPETNRKKLTGNEMPRVRDLSLAEESD